MRPEWFYGAGVFFSGLLFSSGTPGPSVPCGFSRFSSFFNVALACLLQAGFHASPVAVLVRKFGYLFSINTCSSIGLFKFNSAFPPSPNTYG